MMALADGLPALVMALVVVVALIVAMANSAAGQPQYEISNISKKRSERASLEIASDEFSRMRGLMFREKIVPILFEFGYVGLFPIHSYFVKDAFDAVYIDSEGRVVEVYRKIPPNTALVSPKKSASYLLELPCGMTDRLGIEEGDRLRWRKS